MKRLPATVLWTVLLLVLAIGGFVFVKVREAGRLSAERDLLLQDVTTEIAKGPAAADLSSLVTRIRAVPGYEEDWRFRLALAQIERARGHYQQAWELLQGRASGGDATVAELHEGAAVSLELHAHSGDRQLGRRAMELAEHAYAVSHQPEDLLIAWQAALRTGAAEDRQRLAKLAAEHAGSKEARLIARMEGTGQEDLAQLSSAFAEEPVELALARIFAMLNADQTADAAAEADRLCQRAPGIVDVRHFAAAASLALAARPGTPEATVQSLRLRALSHLDWLLKNAPEEDDRRPKWTALVQGMRR
jgi:hypothetical protein